MKNQDNQLIRQIILLVANLDEAQALLYQLLGRSILAWQIEKISQTSCQNLIFLLPLKAQALKEKIRQLAINYPLRIETFNLDEKFTPWQNLVKLRSHWHDRFFYSPALNFDLVFAFEQMRTWTGDLIISAQKNQNSMTNGSAALHDKYMTACSHLLIKNYLPLTNNYLMSQTFLHFAQDKIFLEPYWHKVVHDFSQEQVVKICQFAPNSPLPNLKTKEKFCLALAQKWWPAIYQSQPIQGQIAPTVRTKGEIIINSQAEVGEFCLLEGPLYLGPQVKVGPYCHLGPNLFLEEKVELDSRLTLQNQFLQQQKVFHLDKIKITQI